MGGLGDEAAFRAVTREGFVIPSAREGSARGAGFFSTGEQLRHTPCALLEKLATASRSLLRCAEFGMTAFPDGPDLRFPPSTFRPRSTWCGGHGQQPHSEILKFRVVLINQGVFFRPSPGLDFFFAADGIADIPKGFKIHQAGQVVAAAKGLRARFPVLSNSRLQTSSHSNIEARPGLIRENVDKVELHHDHGLKILWFFLWATLFVYSFPKKLAARADPSPAVRSSG